jgi:pantothenate kinase-related protein Tda10
MLRQSVLSAVTDLLTQRKAVSRKLSASLEDVYLTLTGERASEGEADVR